jgi:hypothetical protein
MSAIDPFIKGEAFDQRDIDNMSVALNEVCHALKIDEDTTGREVIAICAARIDLRGCCSRRSLKAIHQNSFLERLGQKCEGTVAKGAFANSW